MMRRATPKLITRGRAVRAVAFLTLSLALALVSSMTGCGAKSEKSFPDGDASQRRRGRRRHVGSSGGDGGGVQLRRRKQQRGGREGFDGEPTALQNQSP